MVTAAVPPIPVDRAAYHAPGTEPDEVPLAPQQEAGLATLALPYAPRRGGHQASRRWPATTAGGFCGPMTLAREGQSAAQAGPPLAYSASYDLLPSGTSSPAGGAAAAAAAPPQMAKASDDPADKRSGRARRWASRLSADGWMLVRGGDSAPSLASGASAYGGSQAGAVLRYALAPSSPLKPKAYLRVSGSLGGRVQQGESALGLMLRPVGRIPVAVLGEARLQQGAGSTRVRPVFMAVSELPPLRLPWQAEGELYVQGGWAGGTDATGFFDLGATVKRTLGEPLKGIRLDAGGGLWSGGQRGAARLDVGPRIELRSLIGPPSRRIGVRVGVDWRFRVAGHAEPGSGPAVTVAAGF